ncbi:PH domain-containing protein [Stutzerimonas kunmingensis]|uniref:PH domain-containing protein n=1 Tax=Stutzerimonas kunmingensis TaxID=1211807 RepID=UPI0028AFD843|nr:PH domain-containing protein [Stutzerimonas kunmingensis]
MGYVDESLIPGESVLYRGRLSWWALAPWLALSLLVGALGLFQGAALLVIALVLIAPPLLRYYSTELAFTNKRVFSKTGVIGRRTIELSINRVESVQVHQGVLGRIFNFGTLIVSGAGNPQAPLRGIADPMGFRSAFINAQDNKEVR